MWPTSISQLTKWSVLRHLNCCQLSTIATSAVMSMRTQMYFQNSVLRWIRRFLRFKKEFPIKVIHTSPNKKIIKLKCTKFGKEDFSRRNIR